jgi:Domain of unknown function (DUF4157)
VSAHAVEAAPVRIAVPSKAPPPLRRAALPVGPVDDPAEHEADRVAERFRRGSPRADEPARSFLGRDVLIRTDAEAARRADDLGALAYAVDDEIGFAAGAYRPGAPSGRALIAHELTHAAQKAEGRDARATARRAAVITAADFSVTDSPTTSIGLTPLPTGKSIVELKTDPPGLVLTSGVKVDCSAGAPVGYEVGLVQVETSESSYAVYYGVTPADGMLVARKSSVRKPAGPCVDSRPGAFWTADATGEKSLKPPGCGAKVALSAFSDYPAETYPSSKENALTHKPNYIRTTSMEMAFVTALAVKTPSNAVLVLKWLRWGVSVSGTLKSDAAGTAVTGTTVGTGYWLFGDDTARPPEIPATYAAPSTTCVDIAAAATNSDYVVETNATFAE